jgi:hypothetical protein
MTVRCMRPVGFAPRTACAWNLPCGRDERAAAGKLRASITRSPPLNFCAIGSADDQGARLAPRRYWLKVGLECSYRQRRRNSIAAGNVAVGGLPSSRMHEQRKTAAKRRSLTYPRGRAATLCCLAILSGCDRQPPGSRTADTVAKLSRAEPASTASSFSPAGNWRAVPPASGAMRITPSGASWRVIVRTSGPEHGAATPTDCEVEAEGPLGDSQIAAKLVPFDTGTNRVTAEQVARSPAIVRVTFQGAHADVETDYQGCGLAAYAGGRFVRAASEDDLAQRRALAAGDGLSAVEARYPGARLTIVEGYPWARFAVADGPVLTFDGGNGEMRDGSNTQSRIGDHIAWSDLKPQIKLLRVEPHRENSH